MMSIKIPTDAELVDLAAATYAPDAIAAFSGVDGAMRVFVTARGDGLNQIAIEGTHDPLGWAFDFCALGISDHPGLNQPGLGFVHAGFYVLSDSVYAQVAAVARSGPFSICGHSLGAAQAVLIGARLVNDGLPPVKIGAFAPPRVGGSLLVKTATSVPLCGYEFGNDPVPRVPFRIMPPLPLPQFPYVQVPTTNIGEPALDEFSCHNIANYVRGVPRAAEQGAS